jgi:hypothetical protein
MTSIFDLKTNVDELSSTNEGTSRMEYDQHPPTRDVVGNNFANGAIHFRFQTSGQKWWIPSRSYIRTRFQLTKGDGVTPLEVADDIAPNMGLMSNLFQSAEMRINDKVVSRVADFMPQVDALETRLTKSKSWLDSIGQASNWWETDQPTRQAEVSSDGKIIKAIQPADTTTSRANLGYDAAGVADNNTYEVSEQEIDILRGTNANDLPVGSFAVGDFFSPRSGNNNGEAYKILAIVTDTAAQQTYKIQGAATAQAASTGDFAKVVSLRDGVPSRRVGEFETIWAPPLSLFKIGHALPSGRYELVLNPQTATAYQRRAIESALGIASKSPTLPGGNPNDYAVRVVDMYMYCATVEGPRADDITYLLDLEQTRCQSEKIDTTNFQQKNFDVSPSTYALTVAYQDLRAGENTAVSASKFKSYDNAGAGLVPAGDEELKLNRFFINYSGQNLPAPDADPKFVAGTDYTIQRYSETQIYSGAWFDTGGAETIEEWHDRGAYYYFSWPRDGTDRSTRVNVHQQFDGADTTNMRVLLFDHSKQVARVRVQDGRVVDVQVEDA